MLCRKLNCQKVSESTERANKIETMTKLMERVERKRGNITGLTLI